MSKVIKFYSDSCAPCKAMAPVFDEVVKELGVEAESINIGDTSSWNVPNRQKAAELGIRSIPAFVVYNEQGSPFVKTGMVAKDALKEFISNPQ